MTAQQTDHTFIYLHGWASGPDSHKAQFFARQFAALGHSLLIPDLNQGDFYTLTLSRQLQQVAALLPNTPCTLIGSSFGGLTALWLAERHTQIQRLALMAPALDFLQHCQHILGTEALQHWKKQGELPLYHYAAQKTLPISFNFIEDMRQYPDTQLQCRLPTLILHGRQDDVIYPQSSQQFADCRPWTELHLLDSNHELVDVLDVLWAKISQFCAIN